jgi:branched-chain amino acid transport system permease protein
LAVVTPQIFKLTPFEHWTHGIMGISVLKPDAPFGLPLNPDQWLYLFTLAIAVLAYLAARNLVASRTGRALMAIRDNPIAARSMGVNTALYKSLAFGISALYTGVAGALGAIVIQYINPDSFHFALSVALLVGLVVGGVGTLSGAVVGGLVIAFVPDWASSTGELPAVPERWLQGPTGSLILGALLILLTFVLPGGIVAGVRRWKARVVQVVPQPPPGAVVASAVTNDTELASVEGDNETASTST